MVTPFLALTVGIPTQNFIFPSFLSAKALFGRLGAAEEATARAIGGESGGRISTLLGRLSAAELGFLEKNSIA